MFHFRLQQPALGEHAAKEQGLAMRGGTPSMLNASQTGHHLPSGPPRRAQHASHLSSTPNSASEASPSSRGAGGEQTSYQPPRIGGNGAVVSIVGKSSLVGGNRNGNAGGAVRSARVKVDRVGVGSIGGGGGGNYSEAGGGTGGMRVARPVGGGTTRRARGIALPQEGVNDDDTSIVSDGSSVGALERNKAAGAVAGLRVRCGNAAAFNGSGTTETMVHHSGGGGGAGGGGGGGGSSSSSSDIHLPAGRALRVARRVPSTATQSGAAAVTDGKAAGREGGAGSSGGGAQRVAGRQLKGASPRTCAVTADGEQQQRDACAERMKIGSSEVLREVAAPAVLDRREILRKVR